MSHTIVRGGLVLDIAKGTAEPADILIEDDTIREMGPPGCPAPEGAREIPAARRAQIRSWERIRGKQRRCDRGVVIGLIR